jgi:hypothetical protein
MAKKCKHTTVIWLPAETAQGKALACYCELCGEITDIMHEDEPVYWKDPLPEDEPDESPGDWS